MKPTYIVGAPGAAKKNYYLIKTINEAKPTFNFKGLLHLKPKHNELKIDSEMFPVFDESVTLRKGNTIGAGALVTRSISNCTTVIGVLAKPITNV